MASHLVRHSMVSEPVKPNAIASCLSPLSVIGIWSLFLFVATGGSVVSAGEGAYRHVDSNTERYVTDRRGTPIEGKRTYHAAISDQELEETVARCAQAYHVSPALLMAVIKAESGFNPIVISKAGGSGSYATGPGDGDVAWGAQPLRHERQHYLRSQALALSARSVSRKCSTCAGGL